MELFDSHAHYDDERFADEADEIIKKAYESGVKYILNAASDIATSKKSIQLAEKYDFVYAAVGVHPHEAEHLTDSAFEELKKLCHRPKVVAIGEIGLDYFYDHSPREIQKYWFDKQLKLAKHFEMPFVIHNRDSHEDIMKIIRDNAPFEKPGVFHCYTGSMEMAKELLNMGFYLSFGGPVTFKNAKKAIEVIKNMPLDRLMIETDCPYLTPEPYRGKRNNSSYVRLVAEKIAEVCEISDEEIAKISLENAKRFFRIE